MRYRVQETVVLFVSPDFANKENRIYHDAQRDETKKNYAEDERNDFAPIENDPADVQRDRQRYEARPQRDKKLQSLWLGS